MNLYKGERDYFDKNRLKISAYIIFPQKAICGIYKIFYFFAVVIKILNEKRQWDYVNQCFLKRIIHVMLYGNNILYAAVYISSFFKLSDIIFSTIRYISS